MENSPGPQAPGRAQPSRVEIKNVGVGYPYCVVSLLPLLWESPHPHSTNQQGLVQVAVSQYRPPLACRSLISKFLESWDRIEYQGKPASCSCNVIAQTNTQPDTQTWVRDEGAGLRECSKYGDVCPRPWHSRFLCVFHPSWAFSLWVCYHLLGQVSFCY